MQVLKSEPGLNQLPLGQRIPFIENERERKQKNTTLSTESENNVSHGGIIRYYIVVPFILILFIKNIFVQNMDSCIQEHDIVVDAIREGRRKNRIENTINRTCKILLRKNYKENFILSSCIKNSIRNLKIFLQAVNSRRLSSSYRIFCHCHTFCLFILLFIDLGTAYWYPC